MLVRLRDIWVESTSGTADVCLDGVSPSRPLGFTTGLNFCPPFSVVTYEYLYRWAHRQLHLRTLVDIRKKVVESKVSSNVGFGTPGEGNLRQT